MANQLIQDYNQAHQLNPNLTLEQFQENFDYGKQAPTGQTPVSPPQTSAQIGGYMNRMQDKEQAVQKQLGLSDLQLSQLSDNPVFLKRFFEMSYGDNASRIKDYVDATTKERQREDIKNEMESIQGNAPNAMLLLENALKTKQDVGQQKLGESELFQKAGLEGFFTLDKSLQDQLRVMEGRYGSFINAISRAGQYQANNYIGLANHYNKLTDEYNMQRQEMVDLFGQIDQANRALDLAQREFEWKKELLAYEKGLDNPAPNPTKQELWDTGGLKSADSVDLSQMKTLNTDVPDPANCITSLRETGANMPWGLWTEEDKREAIAIAGFENLGGESMQGAKSGDIILTSEGKYGHGARIAWIEGGRAFLEEWNYLPGQYTIGRSIDLTDAEVLGYIPQDNEYRTQLINRDNIDREGVQPSIYEQFTGGELEKKFSDVPENITQMILNYDNASVYDKPDIRKSAYDAGYGDFFEAAQSGDYTDYLPEDQARYTEAMRFLTKNDKYKTRDTYRVYQNLINGEIDEAKSAVNNAIMNNMSAEIQKQYQGAYTLLQFLERARVAAEVYQEKTGLIPGNIQQMAEYFGQVGDEELAGFKNEINLFLQAYTKSQSGAQFSVQEFERYAAVFPNIKNVAELNAAKIDSFQGALKDRLDADVRTFSNFTMDKAEDIVPEKLWSDYGFGDGETMKVPVAIWNSDLTPEEQAYLMLYAEATGNDPIAMIQNESLEDVRDTINNFINGNYRSQ